MNTSRIRENLGYISKTFPGAVLVPIHTWEENAVNHILATMAIYISDRINPGENTEIVQSNKVSRSHKDSWYRFAYRLEFSGSVRPGKNYILIDHVFSSGGSFSELGRHIESREGKVVLADATATGSHGERLALSHQTVHLTLSIYTA
jgi:hypothetical protein